MKAVLVLCLFVAACAPARLERLSDRNPSVVSSDLARAFGGATDEAATRSLGKWIGKNHGSVPPESPPGYRVTWHPGGPGIFAPHYFDRLEPASSYHVRGLISTPLAWAELTNELWAVPSIRRRYQIWHYLYPTNPPALFSARVMRGKLDELRRFLDPLGDDPAMRRTVVIGHSMGGLLAKSLAVEPRDAFWDAVFMRPLDSLKVTPAERATLREAFFWKPRGNVDRIIFCSVPFRGSRLASSWIGRVSSAIVAPSPQFQDFFREVERKNPGMLQPDYASLTRGKITSVGALAPRRRSMEIFDRLPLTKGTTAHIITGSMDFVVQRASATVAHAESNIEVPAGHGSFHHPLAIAEIIRILELPPAR